MADQTRRCTPAHAVTLSTHPTSEGLVRYRRCGCGRITIELFDWPDPRAYADCTWTVGDPPHAEHQRRGEWPAGTEETDDQDH